MFSQAVRDVMRATGRTDAREEIIAHVNGTIRECQILSFFSRDVITVEIPITSLPFVFPRPSDLRQVLTVQYSNGVFPRAIELGRRIGDYEAYYYATNNGYEFSGISGVSSIKVAYVRYLPRLQYYETETEPAVYQDDKWQYLVNGEYADTVLDLSDLPEVLPDEEGYDEYIAEVEARTELATLVEEALRKRVTNWLLDYWYDLVVSGAVAKILNTRGGEADRRTAANYAQYKQYQNSLMKSESQAINGV